MKYYNGSTFMKFEDDFSDDSWGDWNNYYVEVVKLWLRNR